MRKVLKLTKKAVQTRKRVKFHREFIKRMQKEEQEIQNFLANGNNYNENIFVTTVQTMRMKYMRA